MTWRPKNWFELLAKMLHTKLESGEEVNAAEIYADAMLSALIKYLNGKCDNDEHYRFTSDEHGCEPEGVLRKDCPTCMKELKESE